MRVSVSKTRAWKTNLISQLVGWSCEAVTASQRHGRNRGGWDQHGAHWRLSSN